VAPRQDRRAGRRPRRLPDRGDGLRPHADVVQLGRERGVQRLLLRPRRRARPALPAAPAAAVAAREPRPVPDDVQRPNAPQGVRGGGRVRDAVLRPVRGPGLLCEAVPAIGDLRLEPDLGTLPPPRGERAAQALLVRPLLPRAARIPRVAGGARRGRARRRGRRHGAGVGAPAGAASVSRRRGGTTAPGRATGSTQSARLRGDRLSDRRLPTTPARTSSRRSRASRRRSTTASSWSSSTTGRPTRALLPGHPPHATPSGSATSTIRATRTSARAARAMPASGPRAATTSSSSTRTISCCRGSSHTRRRSSTPITTSTRSTGGRGTGTSRTRRATRASA
jgi:hypothetical protein